MELSIRRETLERIWDDNAFYGEMSTFLNAVIDGELEGELPDCDLIDECVALLEALEREQNPASVLHLVLTKKEVMRYCRRNAHTNRFQKQIAAVLLLVLLGSAAVLYASPAVAEGAQSIVDTIVSYLFERAEETENETDGKISSIYLTFPEDTVFCAESAEAVDLSGALVTALYSDGTAKEVPLSDCNISKTVEEYENGSAVLVVVSYNGCACSILYQLEE